MRHLILCISLLLFFIPSVHAAMPPDSGRRAKLEELKKLRRDLYIQKLGLTATEAEKFFPVWDDYELKLRQAKRDFKQKWKGRRPEELTEQEASEYLADALKLRKTELELFTAASEKLKPLITSKKVVQLPRVQKEVQRELMGKMREYKGNAPGGRPGGGPGRRRPPR